MDFVAGARPDIDDKKLVLIGKLATLVFMVLAALWAPQIERFPSLWQYLQSILSYITPPIVAVFGAGLLWRGARSTAALTTLVVGIPVGILGWIANEIGDWLAIHYLYACGILFLFNCGVMVVVSLFDKRPIDATAMALVWSRQQWRTETLELNQRPWWQNYRYLSLMLSILSLGIVAWWW